MKSKKGEIHWYVIGAIIFLVLIVIIIMIVKGQMTQQAGLVDHIGGATP